MTFSYDGLDRLAGISRSAGVGSHVISSSYSYDGANRLTGIGYADATTNTPLASFTYGYNADGQVASYTGPEGTLNYSYDKDGELTGVSGAAQASYSYDANGNRTMSGYQTGPGNELLNDGQFTYTYDKDGNLLTKRDASGDVWSYSWDYRNRLTEVKETNAQNQVVLDEVFTYDVNNNLIGEAVNGVPQRWTVYDGSTPYLDLTGAGQVSERYLADPNALAQYWARVGVTGQADWMVTDLLGSVRELVSAGGSVEDQIAYDAYGNIVTETNAAAGGRLKYAGGQYDGGLGLTLFGARWYNSVAGRWLSQDPLGLGPDSNPYRYVYNEPTDRSDPSGLFAIPLGLDITRLASGQVGQSLVLEYLPTAVYELIVHEVGHMAQHAVVKAAVITWVRAHLNDTAAHGGYVAHARPPRMHGRYIFTAPQTIALATGMGENTIDNGIERTTRLLRNQGYTNIQIQPEAIISYQVAGSITPPRSGNVNWRVSVYLNVTARDPRGRRVRSVIPLGAVADSYYDANLETTTLRP
jgi:RHS repeat-associated protein